ncbi:P-loop containing nucleoside triphosphate hydrolase protein [Punctularia strigosozonata HHB-11173 SS5]|uniref:P-loop containing nucleoside triphosphate hydrolase protein n=1 Tax=Punctularia strigosozonata (strain HHB-11173) TaxID=741275 RepID=UPI000441669E|nr:P-loop containing nucleoside triphosphate hydrolase protein [Punctularia strigosozonata HHB-11173 SS5]EIN08788.1 P-loop containing nucleoside triphosphate hydrolase protein [Punctularia strigosozonata HHB-11173 SS5]
MTSPTRERADSVDHYPTLWPPYPRPDETEARSREEKNARLEEERQAKIVSDNIDSQIEAERQERRRKLPQAKILLLGQAESGKSTLLKNFQLQFTPKAFRAEAEAWRAVIHFNLVRSVNFLLDLLESSSSPHPSLTRATSPPLYFQHGRPGTSIATSPILPSVNLTPNLRRLKMQLSPLRRVEEMLSQRLNAAQVVPSASSSASSSPTSSHQPLLATYHNDRPFEVRVQSGSGWKAAFLAGKGTRRKGDKGKDAMRDEIMEARTVIDACKADMEALWADEDMQRALKEEGVMLQDQAGFFLSEISRVASRDYDPTADDILRARLQTLGVEEHRLVMETSAEAGKEWIIYDLGGSRGQRATWAPFFEEGTIKREPYPTRPGITQLLDEHIASTIIFLAPVSAFNQSLSEDRSANRLWDSFNLWEVICSNKHLQHVALILLLNKCDVLEAKLKAGIEFGRYVTSYKEQPNDVEHVSKYLKTKFTLIFKQNSPKTRKLHLHLTCAIDIQAMSEVLLRIREVILVRNLQSSDFI